MKLNNMKPRKISRTCSPPVQKPENEASNRPEAQPIKPIICSRILPTRSASRMAQIMPTISKMSIIAAPFAARKRLPRDRSIIRGKERGPGTGEPPRAVLVIEDDVLIHYFIVLLYCDHQCDNHESKGKGRAFTTVYRE